MADKLRFYLNIAIDTPLERSFCYHSCEPVAPGCRVHVPFGRGNRPTLGMVLSQATDEPNFRTKAITDIADAQPILGSVQLELATWLAAYYLFPIGQVIKTMLPGGMAQTKKRYVNLTEAGVKAAAALSCERSEQLAQIFARKPSLTRATFQKKVRDLEGAAGSDSTLAAEFYQRKWLEDSATTSIKARTDDPALQAELVATIQPKKTLTAAQQVIFDQLLAHQKPPGVDLLWGVTGAGKTELYLQFIESLVAADASAQVLVLVPEISLTPQMTAVFEARFPKQIGVVHSAMEDRHRWQQLSLLRQGSRRILIGPRSAVFAGFQNLQAIIVDEEHDSSYKQGSMLRYSGRDVAVVRGKLESAKVILGSATPSMESYANAVAGRYRLLRLDERANQKPLPQIEVLDIELTGKSAQNFDVALSQSEIPIHADIVTALQENFKKGEQSIVLVNRRGYAFFIFQKTTKEAVKCPDCSVSLTFHRYKKMLLCHYCDHVMGLDRFLKTHDAKDYALVGYGSEQVEEYIQGLVSGSRVARIDSDTTQKTGLLEQLLGDFREGAIDILVGTQMLAKGHDFPNVTLICLLEVDRMLNLPDFRAGERTFQLIVQAAGRAGRSDLKGRVLLQTTAREHPILRLAMTQNFAEFASAELQFRKQHYFPPSSRMVYFEFSSLSKPDLTVFIRGVKKLLVAALSDHPELSRYVQIIGPNVPALEQIRKHWREVLLLSAASLTHLRQLTAYLTARLQNPPRGIKVVHDIDPQSLM